LQGAFVVRARSALVAILAGALSAAACSASRDGPDDGDALADVHAGEAVDGEAADAAAAGPRPDDGVKNGDETDVDCGGSVAPKCAPGKACLVPADCESAVCAGKVCQEPRPDDGVKNGDETDIDCGGSAAPKCEIGKGCEVHDDCTSDGCAYDKRCASQRSCVLHHGGDTCGPAGATGDCCASISVPRPEADGGAFTLDTYVVTAGRMRAMVERLGGNVRGWIQANRPEGFSPAWDAFLPSQMDDPANGFTGYDGVYQQLGPWTFYPAAGGNRGCNVEGPGARTFRAPDAINQRWGDMQRYPQNALDEKALNCVSHYMMAAFCAWDGGRLPSVAEIRYAFTGGEDRTYPWGNAPPPAGWDNAYGFDPDGKGFGTKSPANGDLTRANHKYNWWSPAARIDNDYSVYLAPPGRFPAGNGKFGHADLGGLVHQWTAERTDTQATFFRNGSWENHAVQNGTTTRDPRAKYYAIGGRCAR
jgi:formylglycine-generating enzyme required for sulfatase activity